MIRDPNEEPVTSSAVEFRNWPSINSLGGSVDEIF